MRSGPETPLTACHAGLDALPPAARALFGAIPPEAGLSEAGLCKAGPIEAGLFHSLPWYETVCAAALPDYAEALFVSVSAGGRMLALFPMRRDVTRISSLTTPYTSVWRPLTAPGLTAGELHGVGRAFGRWCRSWDTVRLDALDLRGPDWPLLLDGMREAGLRALPFDHFGNWSAAVPDWDAYLAARPGQLREVLRRRGRKLVADGATFRVVRHQAGLPEAIAAYEAVYAASWKQPEPFPAFNGALMQACARQGWLRLGLLENGGDVLAAQFWVVQGGTAAVLKLAHDERAKAASPGTVLTGFMIRHLVQREGVARLDFGRGDDDYKQSWTDTRAQLQGLVLAHPWRLGGVAAVGKRKVRDLVKRFFFEKKNEKTFAPAPTVWRIFHHPCAAQVAKVFASFFKKKRFLLRSANAA